MKCVYLYQYKTGLKETKNDGFEGLEWKNEKNLM